MATCPGPPLARPRSARITRTAQQPSVMLRCVVGPRPPRESDLLEAWRTSELGGRVATSESSHGSRVAPLSQRDRRVILDSVAPRYPRTRVLCHLARNPGDLYSEHTRPRCCVRGAVPRPRACAAYRHTESRARSARFTSDPLLTQKGKVPPGLFPFCGAHRRGLGRATCSTTDGGSQLTRGRRVRFRRVSYYSRPFWRNDFLGPLDVVAAQQWRQPSRIFAGVRRWPIVT